MPGPTELPACAWLRWLDDRALVSPLQKSSKFKVQSSRFKVQSFRSVLTASSRQLRGGRGHPPCLIFYNLRVGSRSMRNWLNYNLSGGLVMANTLGFAS